MKLTFFGAAHEVTGSCTLLEVGKQKILVDCGMEQGADIYENQSLSVPPASVDCLLLTHAHIDHSGLLPLLSKNGFRGVVYTTAATRDLCRIMLADSAHIQEFEAEWRNRKAKREGKPEYVPLYEQKDVDAIMKRVCAIDYGTEFQIAEGVTVRFQDAGHLLGSASVAVTANENGERKIIIFSGDLGKKNKPILHDFALPDRADYVVVESTYGNRDHDTEPDYAGELSKIIDETFGRGGNLVIPAFAVGRTQELLYLFRKIKQEKMTTHDFEVYLDSPLAVEATEVFSRNYAYCLDPEMVELLQQGINPLRFPGLHTAVTTDESKAINDDGSGKKIIISASGMCEAGRIRHHLKHNLWRADSTVLFVGYQVSGTVGNALLNGAKSVKLFGETVEVNARIERLKGSSSHADRTELCEWLGGLSEKPLRVFVNHGDSEACEAFSEKVNSKMNLAAVAPYSGECWDLIRNVCIAEGNKQRKEKESVKPQSAKKSSAAYAELLSASRQLQDLVDESDEVSYGELRKLTDGIKKLLSKYRA